MKAYIETYGCAANQADTNIIKNMLMKGKITITDNPMKADIVIINTCTVRGETQLRMVKRIKMLSETCLKTGAKLIVAGCMAKAQPALITKIAPKASLISPKNVEKILKVIKKNNRTIMLQDAERKILPKHINGRVFTIPIAEGCLGNCTYCIVKLARGRLKSHSPNRILEEIRRAVKRGAKEIRLTAQDTAVYGLDIGTNLPELIKQINEIEGDFIIRVGMMTPNSALKILDELLEVYDYEKVYKFIHLPLQSGDDRILKLMNRGYTVEQFKTIVKKFRDRYAKGFIATDVIIGFPTESEEEYENTVKVIREIEVDKVHIAKYSPRPHTLAAMLPQVPEKIKKRRSRELTKIAMEIGFKRNSLHLNSNEKVIVLEKGNRGNLRGRLRNYRMVILKGGEELIGRWVNVKITDADSIQLKGKLAS
ncbi:MAG: 2-methylthioadenine synthetase [Candidatus Methanomethylicota archaeon]|nr:MAG: 2-methylthioadenine synthetase [Candidatus Verstraetearchaeota archaeon]